MAGLPSQLLVAQLLLGRWEDGGQAEHWAAAGHVMWGLSFSGGAFEVLSVELDDGVVRYVARPGGGEPTEFPLASSDDGELVFLNREHDFPQRIRYERKGAKLKAAIGPAEGKDAARFAWKATPITRSPVLEAADQAWSEAVAANGVSAWLAGFDPEGFQWDDNAGQKVPVGPAMEVLMADTLSEGLRWAPTASGLSPDGQLGWTVGEWTLGTMASGSYVTVWRKQADGTWKVLFDTGDADG